MNSSLQNLSWVDDVINIWNQTGVKIENGASIEMISETQILIDFHFPQDFIDLYTRVNGFKDLDWNEHMFSFWSLDRIISEYRIENDENFVGFCDFLISSYSIGFSKNTNQIFKHFDRINPISSSFRETVILINSSSGNIY